METIYSKLVFCGSLFTNQDFLLDTTLEKVDFRNRWNAYLHYFPVLIVHLFDFERLKGWRSVFSQFPFRAHSLRHLSALLSSFSCRKTRKGKAKGQKRKRKKNRDKTYHDAYVSSAFSTYLHLSVALLIIKLIWEEIICPY